LQEVAIHRSTDGKPLREKENQGRIDKTMTLTTISAVSRHVCRLFAGGVEGSEHAIEAGARIANTSRRAVTVPILRARSYRA
jgi:hypothetical protein